ncbi:MAG: hypothetical protein EPO20_17565 [Betaproteobacteria bacterium]|nr:MAG: hypothetical protein EPO20_17565 [Betaproteobacteria bacterium]
MTHDAAHWVFEGTGLRTGEALGRDTCAPLVGMMHGLAGSAALLLLTLGGDGGPLASLAYSALFGLGSILGMALLSAMLAAALFISYAQVMKEI